MPIIKLYNAFDPLGDPMPLEMSCDEHPDWASVLDEAAAAGIWPSLATIPRQDLRFCRKNNEGSSVYLERVDILDEEAKKKKRKRKPETERRAKLSGSAEVELQLSSLLGNNPLAKTPTRSSARTQSGHLDSGLGSEPAHSPIASTSSQPAAATPSPLAVGDTTEERFNVLSNLKIEVNGRPYHDDITSDLTLGQIKDRIETLRGIEIAWILLDDVHQSPDMLVIDLNMERTGDKLEFLSRTEPNDLSSVSKKKRQEFKIQLVGVPGQSAKKWHTVPGAIWSDRTTYVYDRLHDIGIDVPPFNYRLSRWLENADFEFPAVGQDMSCSKQEKIKLRIIPQKHDSRIRMRYKSSENENDPRADDDGYIRKVITDVPRHISLRDFRVKVAEAFGVPPEMQTLCEGDYPMANEISDPINSKRLYCIIEDENSEFTLVKETRNAYRRETELRETWVRDVEEGTEKWKKRKM